MNLALVRSDEFYGVSCDFYRSKSTLDSSSIVGNSTIQKDEIWMTREQIGQALEYETPELSIANIHLRHKKRLDQFSTHIKLIRVEGNRQVEREVTIYSTKGIYEICRWSRQPKADAFMDFVWDTMEAIRTGQMINNPQNGYLIQQEIIRRLEILEAKVNRPTQIILQPIENKPSELVEGKPRQRTRVRIYCAIDLLPKELFDQVNQMIDNKYSYDKISQFLKDQGHDISRSSVGNYALKYLKRKKQIETYREQAMAVIPAEKNN